MSLLRLSRLRTLPDFRTSFNKSRSRSAMSVISVFGVASAATESWGNAKSEGVNMVDWEYLMSASYNAGCGIVPFSFDPR